MSGTEEIIDATAPLPINPDKIKNKKVKGCVICQNPKIAAISDPAIFNAECDWKQLKDRLATEGYYVDVGVISNHAKHVFYDDNKEVFIEKPSDTSLELLQVENSSNLSIIKDGLASILKAEKKLVAEGKEGTKEYLDIIIEKRRLIELKAKLEGEIDDGDKVFAIPAFVRAMED